MTVADLDGTSLGKHYRIRTRDGLVEGQLWKVEHQAQKVEESTMTDPLPRYGVGTSRTTIEIGDYTSGQLDPNTECEAIG